MKVSSVLSKAILLPALKVFKAFISSVDLGMLFMKLRIITAQGVSFYIKK